MLKVTLPRNTLSGIWNVSTLPVLEQARSVLLSSQFWPMLSMSRGVINCAKLFLSHRFSRIKSFHEWAVDRDPFLTSTTSAKIGKTAIARHSAHHLDPKTLRFPTVSICSTLLVCLLGNLD